MTSYRWRYWSRLIDAPVTVAAGSGVRDRSGPFLRRYWAALIGAPLFLPPESDPVRPEISVAVLADSARAARRTGDLQAIRVADTALVRHAGDPVPADLLDAIRRGNRFLAFALDEFSLPRLDTDLAYASGNDNEATSLGFARGPFTFRLRIADFGLLQVSVSAEAQPEELAFIERTYGVMILPLRIASAAESTTYLVALEVDGHDLHGHAEVPVPPGHFVEADTDGPPIGAAEAGSLDPALVTRSIRTVHTRSGLRPWLALAGLLVAGSPVKEVIEAEAR
ncbi:hypothetical protein [Nonomuraea sp. B19D2]|uniref:hypothetical protein n=1 Tax=Nonomuraea sp. B19D2 TaxID=3159561 RepID=UPI0032DA86E4